VKITDQDLETYLAAHQKEYTTPDMIRIEAWPSNRNRMRRRSRRLPARRGPEVAQGQRHGLLDPGRSTLRVPGRARRGRKPARNPPEGPEGARAGMLGSSEREPRALSRRLSCANPILGKRRRWMTSANPSRARLLERLKAALEATGGKLTEGRRRQILRQATRSRASCAGIWRLRAERRVIPPVARRSARLF